MKKEIHYPAMVETIAFIALAPIIMAMIFYVPLYFFLLQGQPHEVGGVIIPALGLTVTTVLFLLGALTQLFPAWMWPQLPGHLVLGSTFGLMLLHFLNKPVAVESEWIPLLVAYVFNCIFGIRDFRRSLT